MKALLMVLFLQAAYQSYRVQGQALVFNAAAEIGVGFLLLVGLVSPQRSLLLTFVYWKNFLPTRYHTPDAAGYHRQAKLSQSLIEGCQRLEELSTALVEWPLQCLCRLPDFSDSSMVISVSDKQTGLGLRSPDHLYGAPPC